MNLLEVEGVVKLERKEPVIDGISFIQQRLWKIAIAGESGAGKSTLLKIIGGLSQPDAGRVLFENDRVKGPFERLIPGHPSIAYLSQHFELRNLYRVEEILSYGNNLPEEDAGVLYDICRIGHLLKRMTDQVSGGEKQRIALARLLVTSPKLLLLDEPFSNLDLIHKNTLKDAIRDIGERLQITCILVSHDPLDTLSWADEIFVMRQGRIVQRGSPQAIYERPLDAYVAGLFGRYNLVSPALQAAFGKLPEAGKRLFLRPERISVAAGREGSPAKPGVSGIAGESRFLGNSWEMEILAAGDKLIVQANTPPAVPGESVTLSLPPGTDHWL